MRASYRVQLVLHINGPATDDADNYDVEIDTAADIEEMP